MNTEVKEYELYEAGVKYNNNLKLGDKTYYEQIDVNLAFANGDQWRNVDAADFSKPTIPILQKAKQHTVANLTSTNISATVQPLEYSTVEEEITSEMQEEIKATEIANAEIRNILDDVKYEFKVREGLGDAFDLGDMCLHWYWDSNEHPYKGKFKTVEGKLKAELIDGNNVMFGNPNNPNPQQQPYILIIGRDLTKTLQEEAKKFKFKGIIEEDNNTEYQAGDNGKIELESDKLGKSQYFILYKRVTKTRKLEDGTSEEYKTILATKFVKNGYIYKNVDTHLNFYPVAWMNYRKQKNSYHGIAATTGLITNQIAINKLLAMVIFSVMNTAFPTMIYDADSINGVTNEIGQAIPVENMNGKRLNDVAGYLETGRVSDQVISIIKLIIDYTKDMIGINDAATGNVTPDNTSAIALAEKLSAVPLENVKSNLYEFTEQCIDIILDFIGTKYGSRPVLIEAGENRRLVEHDFSNFKDLAVNKRIDVGAIGYANELTSLKELRDLLDMGKIETVEYLERLPEYTIPKVKELVEDIKARTGYVTAKEMREKQGEFEQMAQFFETLPIEEQEILRTLPDEEMENRLRELMKGEMSNAISSQEA